MHGGCNHRITAGGHTQRIKERISYADTKVLDQSGLHNFGTNLYVVNTIRIRKIGPSSQFVKCRSCESVAGVSKEMSALG